MIEQGPVQSQADCIHLVHFTDAIVSVQHLHSVKSCIDCDKQISHAWRLDTQRNDSY